MGYLADKSVLVTGGSGFIGSHLIARLEQEGCEIVNIDLKEPQKTEHVKYWSRCDIKNKGLLLSEFERFQPTHVIHLAAKANLNGRTPDDFPDNTIGTKNIVDCVNATGTVELLLHTSTQYVVRPGILPADSTFLDPYTAYGESKALAEKMVRTGCNRCWSIVRPTNIWGPLHPHFPYEMWKYLQKRYYVHPGYSQIRKYYGYIDNAVEQIIGLLSSHDPGEISGTTWYITDKPIDNAIWMDKFSLALSGKRARRVPLWLWRMMAFTGDLLRMTGVRFPVYSDRLFRLSVNENLPDNMIADIPDHKIVSLDEGVRRSVEWYLSLGRQADDRCGQ